MGWESGAGLLPRQKKETSWPETTIAPRAEYSSQDLNRDNYFDSPDALGEEEEESLQVTKNLISTVSNTIPPNMALSLFEFSYPPSIGNLKYWEI